MQARPPSAVVQGCAVELRPFTDGHRESVLHVLAARDTHDFGVADFTRKIVFDHVRANASNAVLAADRDEVFGCAAIHDGGAIAFVDPARERQGTGSALLAWTEAQGRALGRDYHRQWIPDGNASGQRLMREAVCRRWGPSVGYIDLLAVIEPERGQGLGSLLLLSAFADFAYMGLGEATLDVASDNQRALRVYERAGMTARHRINVFEKRIG